MCILPDEDVWSPKQVGAIKNCTSTYAVCANVGLKKRKCNLTAQNEQYKDPYVMHFPFRVVDGKTH